jgi:protein disulfide-isomerase
MVFNPPAMNPPVMNPQGMNPQGMNPSAQPAAPGHDHRLVAHNAGPQGPAAGGPHVTHNVPPAHAQPPATRAQPQAPQAAPPSIPAGNPPLGVEGYCPVTLIKEKKWIRGDVKWGAIHRGRTYLFTSKEKQEEFLKTPDQFSPMLSGFDPVKYADNGILVPGRRQHGLFYGKQIYLFSDEDAVNRFASSPGRYTPIIRQAMTQGSETTQR